MEPAPRMALHVERAMFDITENIPLPSETTKEKQRAKASINNLIKRFQTAYRAVYGKTPQVVYNDPWIKIDTQKTRVNASRLKEMSRQLESRLL